MHNNTNNLETLITYLANRVTPQRWSKIQEIACARTDYLAIVLEDIQTIHNASAVIRSAECFGINDVYIIENKHQFSLHNDVSKGADKWVDIHVFNDPKANNVLPCYNTLRNQEYTIVATTPHPRGCSLDNLTIDNKIALVFGTEQKGLSQQAMEQADAYVYIPMLGFTQSLNISVCAAICMYSLLERIKKTNNNWQLDPKKHQEVILNMLKQSIPAADSLITHFYGNR